MNLLEESKRIKSLADRVLTESGIINTLSGYGEVKIGGSYALDVMIRPDIDIFVIARSHDWDKVLQIQSEIMKSKYFREFDFVNWVDFKDESLTKMSGYYFQPWVPIDDQLFKVDIWLITPEHDKSSETTEHFRRLLENTEDSSKMIILQIKDAMRQGKKYQKGVDGKLIYKAVLEDGVKDVEGFIAYLGKATGQV